MAERQSVRVGVVVVVVIVVVVGAVVVVVVAATSDQAAAQLRGLEQAWGATSVLEAPTTPFSNSKGLCHLRAVCLSVLPQEPF